MERIFEGVAGKLCISEPELFVDNKSRHRSGHMSHAMVEYEPGRIIAFNSNCSPDRLLGHSAHGWIEYRYSDDYGKTWSDFQKLQYSWDEFMNGVYTISIEKAVICNGVITLFAVRNSQCVPICCEPWDTPYYLQSYDYGKTWTEPKELSPYKGRIYDAVVKDNVIYAMEVCNDNFVCKEPEHVYRLFCSTDNGKTFQERSVVGLNAVDHAYGSMVFRDDGSLVVYGDNIPNGFELDASVSYDNGYTWEQSPTMHLAKGMRNVQVAKLGNGYVMHGRGSHPDVGSGCGFVFYTSKDGLNWDDGYYLEESKKLCYYSNNLLVREPGQPERLLVQYSDQYQEGTWRVNVNHLWLSFC